MEQKMINLELDVPTSNEWHVLKGNSQYGPYQYAEVIHYMQEKLIFDFDYVWSPHLESWTHLSDLPEFSFDRIFRLFEKNSSRPVFHMRAHERANCHLPLFAHDNEQLWNGHAESISLGGALAKIGNPLLLPGQVLTLHFKATVAASESFNVQAEILSKRLTKERVQHDTGIYYAVKFHNASEKAQNQIQTFIQKYSQKKGA